MTWQDKMKWIVEGVLNEGREDENPYEMSIHDSHNTTITYEGNVVQKCEYLRALESHWRSATRETILNIINDRIAAKISYADKSPN